MNRSSGKSSVTTPIFIVEATCTTFRPDVGPATLPPAATADAAPTEASADKDVDGLPVDSAARAALPEGRSFFLLCLFLAH